ncbi:MAG: magnesium transporter CorA family protein [Alphaproteobacteria bacterium]|nr:magnesium transporter CorA family protein [Alphaproteobacteria bacterium]
MLRIYRTEEDGKLVKLKKNKILPMTWISLVNPNEDELQLISNFLHVDYDLLNNSLDADERSRIEQDTNSLAIIINLPLLDDEGNFDTLPCGLVLTAKNLITICARDNRVLNAFNRSTAQTFDTRERARFLLNILYKCTQYYLKYLTIINKRTEDIEYALRKTTSNKELFQLMEIQKSLVYFTTALKDNHLVLLKLLRLLRTPAIIKLVPFTDDDIELLDDVIIENKQAIEMVDMHRSILEGMMDGFASIINNNVNLVMKFLAAITIILSIPTMLASFWGMNVPVAFANNPNGFWIVMGLSAFGTIATIIYFRKRGMF